MVNENLWNYEEMKNMMREKRMQEETVKKKN
jgi:hypothetical protein